MRALSAALRSASFALVPFFFDVGFVINADDFLANFAFAFYLKVNGSLLHKAHAAFDRNGFFVDFFAAILVVEVDGFAADLAGSWLGAQAVIRRPIRKSRLPASYICKAFSCGIRVQLLLSR